MSFSLVFDLDFDVVDVMIVFIIFVLFLLRFIWEVFDGILIPLVFLQRDVETAYQSTDEENSDA